MAASTCSSVPSDLFDTRPGEEAAFGARMPSTDGFVVRVEDVRVGGVEGHVPGRYCPRTKVSKNQVVCARCHLVGLTSGIVWTVWSSALRGAERHSVIPRTSA